jgi:hypothetical protein
MDIIIIPIPWIFPFYPSGVAMPIRSPFPTEEPPVIIDLYVAGR